MIHLGDATVRNVTDGSGRPPRLVVYGNEWGLLELPHGSQSVAWDLDTTLARLAEAGFDGFQGSPATAGRCRTTGLRFSTSGRANTPAEVFKLVNGAADVGADSLTLHVGWGMESDDEADALADAVLRASGDRAMPTFVETHRATMAQDIWRTARLIERRPALRFNGDFSHYYCGQEMGYRGFDRSRAYLDPILRRTAFLHGRVSDGQCMQADLTDPAVAPHVANFRWMWRSAMAHWLATARPGDLLPFVPELGPPSSGYSISRPRAPGEAREELCDRWQQTVLLRTIAMEDFNTVLAGVVHH